MKIKNEAKRTPLDNFKKCSPSGIVTSLGIINYLQSKYVDDSVKKEFGDFIVRAANNHKELVRTVTFARNVIDSSCGQLSSDEAKRIYAMAVKALDKVAEGK